MINLKELREKAETAKTSDKMFIWDNLYKSVGPNELLTLIECLVEAEKALENLEVGAEENQCDGCGLTTMLSFENKIAIDTLIAIRSRINFDDEVPDAK